MARMDRVHEVSIAQSLVELIESQLMAAQLFEARVKRVRVAIGEASAVVPGALVSAWGPASAASSCAGASLTIERVPVAVWCEICGAEYQLPDQRLVCPECGGRTPTMVRGNELELLSLEFADDDNAPPTGDHPSTNATHPAGAPADPEEQ